MTNTKLGTAPSLNEVTIQRLFDLANELTPSQCGGYLQKPLPCEADENLDWLVDFFARSSSLERGEIMSAFGIDQSPSFLAYAERMAILSVRNHSEMIWKRGVYVLLIEGLKYDDRETIMRLALLDCSARKIGCEPDVFFEGIVGETSGRISQVFRDFLNRSVENRRIGLMGYYEDQTAEGFSYSRNW